uniref:Pept_C1 domain-containing protein n=1 Tax=Caenorhabditis tropicalis TaxID=1561998 RepID=A0A1I7TYA4_9PELO
MVSSKVLNSVEKKNYEKVLDKERIREEFLLDPDYPPRPKRFNKILIIFATIIFFSFGVFLTCYFNPKLFKLLTRRQGQIDSVEFRNAYQKEENENTFLKREKIFLNNVKRIQEYNSKNPGVTFDINHFAYWSDEEISSIFMQKKEQIPFFQLSNYSSYKFENNLPDYFDWRKSSNPVVTRVKDQGQCGSYWAFSVVAAIESQFAIKKKMLLSLSEQELVDCDVQSKGCQGGYVQTALLYAMEKGLETDTDYPYSGIQHNQCSYKKEKVLVKIDNAYKLKADEDLIANVVANNGPVSFLMPVPRSFMSYRSGIFNPSWAECQTQAVGNHVITIVGFGREGNLRYWIVKNSFGTGWGEQGYFRMARGFNVCGFTNNVFTPMIN